MDGLRRLLALVGVGLAGVGLVLAACAPAGAGGASPAAAPAGGSAPRPAGEATAAGAAPSPESRAASGPATRTALRVGLNTVGANMTPFWTAKDLGLFDEQGLDVEFVVLQSSSQVAKVMAAGEVPIASSAASSVVDAVLAGDDQVLLSGMQNSLNFWIYARPEISRVAALRDKPVGTARFGSSAHLALVDELRRAGLDPERDVTLIQSGGMNEIFGALSAGAVSAGILSLPFNLYAEDAGLRLLVDVAAERIPYLTTGVATTRHYLQANEDVARRFLKAQVAGLARMHQDKASTVQVLSRNLNSDDLPLLERTYDVLVQLFERVPYPTAASIQTAIDQRAADNPAARSLTPAMVSDDRLLRELDDSGYIQGLYASAGGAPASATR